MIVIYCRKHHSGNDRNGLCDNCRELLGYASRRLDNCKWGDRKPSCRKCAIHCYSPVMKKRIREVMKYAGPRMMLLHPVDAIRHLFSELVDNNID